MSTLNISMAVASMREGRNRSSTPAQALSSLRAASRERRRGTSRPVRLKSKRRSWTWWIPLGPATAFRQRCCSPCVPSGGSGLRRSRRPIRRSSVGCCHSRRIAQPSPAAGPAPIRRGHPRSARNCRVSWLVRRARRSVLLRRGQARIKAKRMLNPLCHTKHLVIVSVSADDLEAERKAVVAEPDRKRRGGYAKECPWRAILGVASILQSARRFAERGQCQQRIVAGHLARESVLARFLQRLG